MSTLQIRPAIAADAPLILELIRALADYEKLPHEVTATEARIQQTLFGHNPAAEVLLAYWDGECAGMALYFSTYSTFLAQAGVYLEDLYVRPHLRGKKIGFTLLQELTRLALERGCGRVEWSVLNWNQPSINFYRKLGAVPLDEWTKYRLDLTTMQKLASMRDLT